MKILVSTLVLLTLLIGNENYYENSESRNNDELSYEARSTFINTGDPDCRAIVVDLISIDSSGQRLLAASGIWNFNCTSQSTVDNLFKESEYIRCGEIEILEKTLVSYQVVTENYTGKCLNELITDDNKGEKIKWKIKKSISELMEE